MSKSEGESLDEIQRRVRRQSFSFACRAYFVMGLISVAAGAYLYFRPVMRDAPGANLTFVCLLTAFGLLRMGNALWQMRRLPKRRDRSHDA